ncbi:inovirus Gp2 family protein [Pseudoalteromonas sp. 120-MNA-CIBAN-0494]|uniref:inovirus Gp2 family protein n=1 Tax=unclassified Pseudoalteromonas TaxID=194690 RepID=UPI00331DEC67
MKNPTQYQIIKCSSYNEYGVLAREEQPLIRPYLDAIQKVMDNAITEHKRTFAVRIDLRLPDYSNTVDLNSNDVCTRFIASLTAQIKADAIRKKREGKNPHPSSVRFIWAREKNTAHKQHYHWVLLFNKDRYHCTGKIDIVNDNLFTRITAAWASALSLPFNEALRLVHLPKNAHYYLDANNTNFTADYSSLYRRASYLAKLNTKQYGLGQRCFGYSQR